MVLIVVALSFDILWRTDYVPIAEIMVFMYILSFWAYGNLKGGAWEFPLKLGSFNLSITLMTNFYIVGIFGNIRDLGLLELVFAIIALPALCLIISLVLSSYIKESANRTMTLPILIGGTLGYIVSVLSVAFLST